MGLKKCPHCGGEQFYATLMREAIITVNSDNKIAIVKNSPAGERFEVYECANENCKKKINNASLIDNSSVKCKVCSETVSAEDVDENGVCSACRAISNSGKSPMELLRELLGPANVATTAPITPTPTVATTEPVAEEKPKRKRVSRKKKEEAPVEIPAEDTADDATEAPAGFMNAPKEEDDGDDIPFPDFDDTGFKEEEKPKAPAVEEKPTPPTSNAKFSMYDDDEDSDDEDEDDDEDEEYDDDEQF